MTIVVKIDVKIARKVTNLLEIKLICLYEEVEIFDLEIIDNRIIVFRKKLNYE